MKKLVSMTLFLSIVSVYAMDEQSNPMDSHWFYDEKNPYAKANQYMQHREWFDAEKIYGELLKNNIGNYYDQNKAKLNGASARLAQDMPSELWIGWDNLCIAEDRKIKGNIALQEKGTICFVGTDKMGIGDIAHFFGAINKLKKIAPHLDIKVTMRKFLHKAFEGPAKEYQVTLLDEKDPIPLEAKETHLVSLLGHLYIRPHELRPDRPIYTTSKNALSSVKNLLNALKKQSKKVCPIFLGENRQATLIGGKQLPHDTTHHGRQVNASALEVLLKDKSIVLLDCNPEKSRIKFVKKDEPHLAMAQEFENRVVQLPHEEYAFDTTIALLSLINAAKKNEKYISFCADNGPANLFIQGLAPEKRDEVAMIIPNENEYDVRMEGKMEKGTHYYQHRILSCRVYRCKKPEQQGEVIMQAYNEITSKK